MSAVIDLSSARARDARTGKTIGKAGYQSLAVLAILSLLGAVALGTLKHWRYASFLSAFGLAQIMPAIWWKRELATLPPRGSDLTGRLSADILMRLKPGMKLTPLTVWEAIEDHWQTVFCLNHLMLSRDMVKTQLTDDDASLNHALDYARSLADNHQAAVIELGFLVAGLLEASPAIKQMLTQMKQSPEDIDAVANWMARNLAIDQTERTRRKFGGIGRDWAFGFTPLLDRLGYNISLDIADHGSHFGWLTHSPGVKAIETAFANRTTAIALIGPEGIGKSTSIYALAQKLIEGNTSKGIAYHQIIGLNATDIVSRAQGPGQLEHIMIRLANEAAKAGHIILFLDDAQLFFSGGPGSFDGTQILLSIVQARSVPIIMAMSGGDYQRLKSQNPALANLLTPIVLQELPEAGVMKVLEDTTLGLENRHHVLITYDALHTAYRLSGRYEQDEAFPGKAIKLLEQSVSHADNSIVSSHSVEAAVEQTYGVKASSAQPVEADQLLNLEDNIHKRMINQSHAVSVVANALRRARAGVTNPKRPIGSFLFLGPTGVGKTELAKAVAATYFGSESSMIRLDMSEYQGADDVKRLLSAGQSESSSLILSVRQQPFSVVLLDEVEKAHPNILNLLLQLLDEGQLTDESGRVASFKDCVIIATSNAGANTIRERVGQGEDLSAIAGQLTDELISSGQFKPELLNRFDEVVFFRPLTADELGQIVGLMVNEVNSTLASQNISIELTPEAVAKIVAQGNDPRLGARPMRRSLQRVVENTLAQKILRGEVRPGDHVVLNDTDLTD